jgi:transposase-like protein
MEGFCHYSQIQEDSYVYTDLIASLDVEEKFWAKDRRSKGVEGQTSSNMVHHPYDKGKGKRNKNNSKSKQNTTFKKKKKKKVDKGCFMCSSPDH